MVHHATAKPRRRPVCACLCVCVDTNITLMTITVQCDILTSFLTKADILTSTEEAAPDTDHIISHQSWIRRGARKQMVKYVGSWLTNVW